MIIFIILRDYAFSFFSINGMETETYWIAIFGTIIMLAVPFSMISSKMLDGFGKSMFSLFFTIAKIGLELFVIYGLYIILSNGSCVLIGIAVSEVIFSFVYYFFLRYLFKNFDKEYENKETVKTFNLNNENEDNVEVSKKKKIASKIPLILGLISLTIVVMDILLLPVMLNNYPLLIAEITALIICISSIYLMERLNRPKTAVIGFIISAIILSVFMGRYSYLETLLFVVTSIATLYIKIIVNKLKNVSNQTGQ